MFLAKIRKKLCKMYLYWITDLNTVSHFGVLLQSAKSFTLLWGTVLWRAVTGGQTRYDPGICVSLSCNMCIFQGWWKWHFCNLCFFFFFFFFYQFLSFSRLPEAFLSSVIVFCWDMTLCTFSLRIGVCIFWSFNVSCLH